MEYILTASKNRNILEKTKIRQHSLKTYLSIPNLERALVIRDCNGMGHGYHRFLGWFKNDPEKYFDVFDWDIDIDPLESWVEDNTLTIPTSEGTVNFSMHQVEGKPFMWQLTRVP